MIHYEKMCLHTEIRNENYYFDITILIMKT